LTSLDAINDQRKEQTFDTISPFKGSDLKVKVEDYRTSNRDKGSSVPRNKLRAPYPYPEDIISISQKVVPPVRHFQGYQRSGALLFNNINSHDTNAFNNNQTVLTQTFNQMLSDNSITKIPKYKIERDNTIARIKGFNDTLMHAPNLPTLGNMMDKTVRFSPTNANNVKDKNLGDIMAETEKANGKSPQSPYHEWNIRNNGISEMDLDTPIDT